MSEPAKYHVTMSVRTDLSGTPNQIVVCDAGGAMSAEMGVYFGPVFASYTADELRDKIIAAAHSIHAAILRHEAKE